SRVQALDAAQRAGRADVVDLDPAGRNADRLRRRAAVGAPHVRRCARPPRHAIAHGGGLRGGTAEPAAEGGVTAGPPPAANSTSDLTSDYASCHHFATPQN